MDVKFINPFIESFTYVMPELGFTDVKMGDISAKEKDISASGVLVILGVVGAVRGNVVYAIDIEAAKSIASAMMMGAPVDEFDDMASSAISELTNMLTANAATAFSKSGIIIDISTPSMLQGENMVINMSFDKVICVQLLADNIPIEINIAFEA